MSGLSTRQPNSEIQDIILIVTKSEKIKYSWKRSSRFTTQQFIKKKKNLGSCTLKYTFNRTTAEQIEMGHRQWNCVLKMYRRILWHSFMKKKSTYTYIYTCILIVCNANGHKSALIYTRDVDLPCSWKKHTKMPKIVVEVGYIVAMPDTLQKDKHSTKPLPEPMLMYIGWL